LAAAFGDQALESRIRTKTIATILLAPKVDARIDVAERLQIRAELIHHGTNRGRIFGCSISNYQLVVCTHAKSAPNVKGCTLHRKIQEK